MCTLYTLNDEYIMNSKVQRCAGWQTPDEAQSEFNPSGPALATVSLAVISQDTHDTHDTYDYMSLLLRKAFSRSQYSSEQSSFAKM